MAKAQYGGMQRLTRKVAYGLSGLGRQGAGGQSARAAIDRIAHQPVARMGHVHAESIIERLKRSPALSRPPRPMRRSASSCASRASSVVSSCVTLVILLAARDRAALVGRPSPRPGSRVTGWDPIGGNRSWDAFA